MSRDEPSKNDALKGVRLLALGGDLLSSSLVLSLAYFLVLPFTWVQGGVALALGASVWGLFRRNRRRVIMAVLASVCAAWIYGLSSPLLSRTPIYFTSCLELSLECSSPTLVRYGDQSVRLYPLHDPIRSWLWREWAKRGGNLRAVEYDLIFDAIGPRPSWVEGPRI